MNLHDERIRVSTKDGVVGEFWVKFESVTGQGVTADDTQVSGNVRVRMTTYWRPSLQALIDSPTKHNVEFLRGYAPPGPVVSAFRKEDRRMMMIEV